MVLEITRAVWKLGSVEKEISCKRLSLQYEKETDRKREIFKLEFYVTATVKTVDLWLDYID